MPEISITIDSKELRVSAGTTILEAAQGCGIHIPTLCHLKGQDAKGVCRICVVEAEGARTLLPACATPVREGMKIHTDSQRVRRARKMNLQLLLSRHPMDCQSCVRMGNCRLEDLDPDICRACFFCDCVKDNHCELQALVKEYDINDIGFEWIRREETVDDSSDSIMRNPNKCIDCRRCVAACGEWQDMHVLGITGRGTDLRVAAAFNAPLKDTRCVECGQCVRSCPVGAVYEKEDFDSLADAVAKKYKICARIEPYFLSEYLGVAGLDPSAYGIGNLIAGLKRLGVRRIEENRAAEEETRRAVQRELRDLFKKQGAGIRGQKRGAAASGRRMVISAACPAAVRFVRQEFPLLAPCLSAIRSPQQYYGAANEESYTVSLSPCSARKAEAAQGAGGHGVDQVISPGELHRLFTRSGVDLARLPACPEDGQSVLQPELKEPGIETQVLDIDGIRVRCALARGLGAARRLLEEINAGKAEYDYVMLQSCPNGCISTQSWLL